MSRFLKYCVIAIETIICCAMLVSASNAFDYEHPERLSAGECWRRLPDGRKVIRSGAHCPESYEHVDTGSQTASEPMWGNVGVRHPAAAGGSYGGGNYPFVSSAGAAPETPQNLYIHNDDGGGEYPAHVSRGYWRRGHAFHPEPAKLPPDQIIFQKIYKNAYPSPDTHQCSHSPMNHNWKKDTPASDE